MERTGHAAVLKAFCELKPASGDHETRAAIARMLGMEWVPGGEEPAADGSATGTAHRVELEPPLPARAPAPSAQARIPEPQVSGLKTTEFRLTPVQTATRKAPDWVEKVAELPRPQETAPVPPDPLFVPRWTRSILSGALSASTWEGPPDMEAIVRTVAKGEAVVGLPRMLLASLARGVQLLIDRGGAMQPFLRDQELLRDQIARVAGSGAVDILQFSQCPTRGAGRGSRRKWVPYQDVVAPRLGTTVAVLTDLGIGTPPLPEVPADATEWLAFAEIVRRHGCPLLALVPYAPARWPADLRANLTIVQWDRRTTASRIRAAIGRGLTRDPRRHRSGV